MMKCLPLIIILVVYAISYIVLGLILDKILMFDRSKDECKLLYTVLFILVVLMLAR